MQQNIIDMVGGKDTPYPPPQRIFQNDVGQLVIIRIEPLKVRHDVIKIEFIVLLLPLWCIDIDLSIQPVYLALYMTLVH